MFLAEIYCLGDLLEMDLKKAEELRSYAMALYEFHRRLGCVWLG